MKIDETKEAKEYFKEIGDRQADSLSLWEVRKLVYFLNTEWDGYLSFAMSYPIVKAKYYWTDLKEGWQQDKPKEA